MKSLSHIVSQERILVGPTNIEVILQWERPKNVTEIRSFLRLGITNVSSRVSPE